MQALQIENLFKTYKNGFEALKGVDLCVAQGQFFALLGPNAAGKSTLIGIITSLISKTSGKVLIFGYDLDKNAYAAKSCIGLVPQEFNFNPVETVQYVLVKQAGYYGLETKDAVERSNYLLEKLDLKHKSSEQVKNLSSGLKRRLMIARSLVHNPKLLILDEPTAGVDIATRRFLWKFLREINEQGTTIILTTHYLEEAESLCRDIAIIDHGCVIKQFAMIDVLKMLNIQSFVLHLKEPFGNNSLNFTHIRIDELTLEVSLNKDESISDIINELSMHGVNVISMRNKTNQLEELFFKLISQSAQRNYYGA